MTIPAFTLSNGVTMPGLGLGTWPMGDREAETVVASALETGYRLIDTAEMYGNESGVGRGIRASGVPREEVFVTTKLTRRWHGFDKARQAFANSARNLGVDRIDLFLIHWPNPDQDLYVETWRGMIRLLEEDKVRSIGVSNFKPEHLDRLVEATGVTPHVNQIQLDPRIPRRRERRYHQAHGIVTECWSPIGKGGNLLDEPVVAGIARHHDKTPAQIVLRWHVELGLIPIPKTSRPRRLAENLDIFDFALDRDQVDRISSLDRHGAGAVDSDRTGL